MQFITHPIFRDGKIMDHGHNGSRQPDDFQELAVGGNAVVADIRSAIALGLVPEADHLVGVRVELRVRRKR